MTSRLMKLTIIALFLSGCASGNAEFNEFVLEDVQQAMIMAVRTDDILSVKCWTYLQDKAMDATTDTTAPRGEVVGALSAYQKTRNVRRTVTNLEISDQFKLECGPMLIDSVGAVSRIGIRALLPF